MAAEGSDSVDVGRPAEVGKLKSYLLRVVPTLLEDEDEDGPPEGLSDVITAAEGRLKRFIEEPQEHVLTIIRTLPPDEEGSSPESSSFRPAYEVMLGVHYRSSRTVGLVIIKRMPVVEADKTIRSQLRLLNLSEDSPFETLHSYVQEAVSPLFNSYVQQSRRAERSKGGINLSGLCFLSIQKFMDAFVLTFTVY